jgi:hypothetical protein
MVTVEFMLNENKFIAEGQEDLSQVEAGLLQLTHFVMPVRFNIDGLELFELPATDQLIYVYSPGQPGLKPKTVSTKDPWLSLPILGFALDGLEKIQQAIKKNRSILSLEETGHQLEFTASENQFSIHSPFNNLTVVTNYQDILTAFKTFASEVTKCLSLNAPSITRHPQWGLWVRNIEEQ